MKAIPGGHNLFVADVEVVKMIENLYNKFKVRRKLSFYVLISTFLHSLLDNAPNYLVGCDNPKIPFFTHLPTLIQIMQS